MMMFDFICRGSIGARGGCLLDTKVLFAGGSGVIEGLFQIESCYLFGFAVY